MSIPDFTEWMSKAKVTGKAVVEDCAAKLEEASQKVKQVGESIKPAKELDQPEVGESMKAAGKLDPPEVQEKEQQEQKELQVLQPEEPLITSSQ